jgi:CheY-like chemotaxis protein
MAKILLVEDDNNLREIFQMRLTAEGHEMVVAADGEEGLVVAMKEKPDLIITDVMMPKLSGFEMVENLRSAPEMKNVKVIMMTALGQAEDQTRGEKLGVVKYLVKSQVTLEDFARVVNEVLGPSAPSDPTANQQIVNKSNNNQESEASMQQDNPSTDPVPTPSDNTPAPSDPAAPAPSVNPLSDTTQQNATDEQNVVQDQINSFVSSTPASAPADTPAVAPAEPATPVIPVPDPSLPAPGETTSPSMPPATDQPVAPAEPTAPAGPDQPSTPPADPTSNAL